MCYISFVMHHTRTCFVTLVGHSVSINQSCVTLNRNDAPKENSADVLFKLKFLLRLPKQCSQIKQMWAKFKNQHW